ncbi:NAD(P)-dependent alcohol dehydrogenase [Nocardiopsis sp. CC223A]|uniref:NAD(P)-dependent alcohol dehydrogenase n=1 Tax=Nocardiopsis sp. CC223A TaxID=3044051 RepID=UPI00278BF1C8|nr:NAD(P)-dependent alcohol dehydrogenase [Nocardiopsis sp. CC223A]
MSTTRAAVAHAGTGSFTWTDVRLDEPRPDEVLVRVVGVGICHTDLSSRDGGLPVPLPAVLGHEGAGVVEAVGGGVTRTRPGDTVLLSFSSCGECPSCAAETPAYCATFLPRNFSGVRSDGSASITAADGSPIGGRFFGQSAFAHRALVDERSVVPVTVSDEDELAALAPLGCGVQTGAGAVLNTLSPEEGRSVAVFGAGAVGLSAVMAAALTGANPVIAVDVVPSRLELALELGATHTVDAAEEDPVAAISKITGGGADFTVECSGVPAVLRQSVDCLAVSGTVAVVGAPAFGTEVSLDVNDLLQGRTVRGVIEGDSDPDTFVPHLVDLHRQGRLPFDRMVRFYAPEQINEAAADAESGRVLKPVLRFDG